MVLKWLVLLPLLVYWNRISSQPITEENARATRQLDFMDCCPCPDSNTRFSGNPSDMSGVFSRSEDVDRCPCPLRDTDPQTSSSIHVPSSMRAVQPSVSSTDSKEDPKPLLHPEVDLASSVLETLREATDEEYREALARDAARSAVKSNDPLFRDAMPEETRNLVTIIVSPKETTTNDIDVISQTPRLQETRCVHSPLGSVKSNTLMKEVPNKQPNVLREIFALPRTQSKGLLHRKLEDMDSSVGASNVYESVVDSLNRGLGDLKLKSNPSLLDLFPQNMMRLQKNGLKNIENIFQLRNIDQNSKVDCDGTKQLSAANVPNFRRDPSTNRIIDSPMSLEASINKLLDRSSIPKMTLQDFNSDNNPSASNIKEQFTEKKSNNLKDVAKTRLNSLSISDIIKEKTKFNLDKISKLKDVELIHENNILERIKKPKINIPELNLKPILDFNFDKAKERTNILNDLKPPNLNDLFRNQINLNLKRNSNQDCKDVRDAKINSHIQKISKDKPVKTKILDAIPGASETYSTMLKNDDSLDTSSQPKVIASVNMCPCKQILPTEFENRNLKENSNQGCEEVRDAKINSQKISKDKPVKAQILDTIPGASETYSTMLRNDNNSDSPGQPTIIGSMNMCPCKQISHGESENRIQAGNVDDSDVNYDSDKDSNVNINNTAEESDELIQSSNEDDNVDIEGKTDYFELDNVEGDSVTKPSNNIEQIIPKEEKHNFSNNLSNANKKTEECKSQEEINEFVSKQENESGFLNQEEETQNFNENSLKIVPERKDFRENVLKSLDNIRKTNHIILEKLNRPKTLSEKSRSHKSEERSLTNNETFDLDCETENILITTTTTPILEIGNVETSDESDNHEIMSDSKLEPKFESTDFDYVNCEIGNNAEQVKNESMAIEESNYVSTEQPFISLVEARDSNITFADSDINVPDMSRESSDDNTNFTFENIKQDLSDDAKKDDVCSSDSDTSNNFVTNTKSPEMAVQASNSIIKTAKESNFKPIKDNILRTALQDVLVQPPSLIEGGNFNTFRGSLPNINNVLNLNTRLPTVDEIRRKLSGILGSSEKDIGGKMYSTIEVDPEAKSSNIKPEMYTDASTVDFIKTSSNVNPLEDINLDIFRLKPLKLKQKQYSPLIIPELNLNSYKAKLAIPQSLDLRPIKLESSLRNRAGILGASIAVGPDKKRIQSQLEPKKKSANLLNNKVPNFLEKPLGQISNLGNMRSKISSPAKSLLGDTQRSGFTTSFSENIRSNTEDAVRKIQQTLESSLKGVKNLDSQIDSLTQSQNLLQMVSNARGDVNDKLHALHSDLTDRISAVHEAIFDDTKLPSLNVPILKDNTGKLSARNQVNPVLESKLPFSLSPTRNSQHNVRQNKGSNIKDQRKLKSFKMASASSVTVPTKTEVPDVKTLTRSSSSKSKTEIEQRENRISPYNNRIKLTSKTSLKPFNERKISASFSTTTIRPISSVPVFKSKSKIATIEGAKSNRAQIVDNNKRNLLKKALGDSNGSPSEMTISRLPAPKRTFSKLRLMTDGSVETLEKPELASDTIVLWGSQRRALPLDQNLETPILNFPEQESSLKGKPPSIQDGTIASLGADLITKGVSSRKSFSRPNIDLFSLKTREVVPSKGKLSTQSKLVDIDVSSNEDHLEQSSDTSVFWGSESKMPTLNQDIKTSVRNFPEYTSFLKTGPSFDSFTLKTRENIPNNGRVSAQRLKSTSVDEDSSGTTDYDKKIFDTPKFLGSRHRPPTLGRHIKTPVQNKLKYESSLKFKSPIKKDDTITTLENNSNPKDNDEQPFGRPSVDGDSFMSKVPESVKDKLMAIHRGPALVNRRDSLLKSQSDIDVWHAASENQRSISSFNEPLKENTPYKCKLVCTRDD